MIRMTQQGDLYENAIAERVSGILKTDFRLNRVFITFEEAQKVVDKSIYSYNHLRPHMSCDYLTPIMAHQSDQPLKSIGSPKCTNAQNLFGIKASLGESTRYSYFDSTIAGLTLPDHIWPKN